MTSNQTPRPAAVLWDMDGTIVDTEPYWMQAEEELMSTFDIDWTHEDSLQVVGASLDHAARVFQGHGVPLEADEIIARLNAQVIARLKTDIPWRPGARELLEELRTAGVPNALVTMSYGEMARIVADALGVDVFATIVTGDLVENGKPHPEPYLRAADELGVAITDCIAIEDSVNGVTSAVASGAATIGIPLHIELPENGGFTLRPSLEGLGVSELSQILSSHKTATAQAEK